MKRRRGKRRGKKKKKKKSDIPPEERVVELEELLVKEIRASRLNEEVWRNRNERLTELLQKMTESNDDLKHEMERVTNENLDILNRERESFRILEIKNKRMTNYNRTLFEEQENLKTELSQHQEDYDKKVKEMKDFYDKRLEQKNKDVTDLQQNVMRHLEARYAGKSGSDEEVRDREIIYQQKVSSLQKQFDRVLKRQKQDYEDRMNDEVSRRLNYEQEVTVTSNKVLRRDVHYYEDEILQKRLENERLKQDKRRLESDVVILQSQCDDLIKRNGHLQHKIYTLEEAKGLRKNEKLFREFEDLKNEMGTKQSQIEKKDTQIKTLKEEMGNIKTNLVENIKTFNVLKKEYQKRFEMNSEIAKFLYTVMKDVKLKLGPWKRISNLYSDKFDSSQSVDISDHQTNHNSSFFSKDDEEKKMKLIPANLDRLDVEEREKVLRYLLNQLNLFTKKKVRTKYVYRMENKERLSLPPIYSSPSNYGRRKSHFGNMNYVPNPREEKNIFRKYRDYRKRSSIYN